MATNMRRAYDSKKTFTGVASDPAVPASGDPAVVGQIPCVALGAEASGGNAAGDTTFARDGSFMLSVKGIDQVGNSAVAPGDILYYVAADTPKISKKNTGVRFGYANGAVVSAATTTIEVFVGY